MFPTVRDGDKDSYITWYLKSDNNFTLVRLTITLTLPITHTVEPIRYHTSRQTSRGRMYNVTSTKDLH